MAAGGWDFGVAVVGVRPVVAAFVWGFDVTVVGLRQVVPAGSWDLAVSDDGTVVVPSTDRKLLGRGETLNRWWLAGYLAPWA